VLTMFKNCTAVTAFLTLSGPALAQTPVQELGATFKFGDLPVTVQLEPRDADCSKKKQIQINKMFCLAATLSSTKDLLIKDLKVKSFDATMPEHRHGMVTRAKITALNSGEYLIEGLKLHMPGDWKFTLEVLHGSQSAQVAIPVKL